MDTAMQPNTELGNTGDAPFDWMGLPTEIHLRTCSQLPIDVMCKLSMTSKYHQSLYTELFSHQMKVMLTKFNVPVNSATYEMRRLGAVIVGIVPLAILSERDVHTFEIDFAVPFGKVLDFERFVLTGTEYRPIRHRMLPLYPTGTDSGIRSIREYRHPVTAHVLRIIEAELLVATSVAFLLPVNVAMTYITWNSIVCPYPSTILKRVTLLNMHRPYNWARGAYRRFLLKYASLGYSMLPDASPAFPHFCGWDPNCAKTSRNVSDSGCMRVTWNEGTGVPDVIDGALGWRLAYRFRCGGVRSPVGVYVATGNGESIVTETSLVGNTLEANTVLHLNRIT